MGCECVGRVKDEIVIGGMLLLITHVCLSTYTVLILHSPFTPGEFGAGAAAILGAMGGGMGVRDWLVSKGAAVVGSASGFGGKLPILEEPNAQPTDH